MATIKTTSGKTRQWEKETQDCPNLILFGIRRREEKIVRFSDIFWWSLPDLACLEGVILDDFIDKSLGRNISAVFLVGHSLS